MKRRQLLVATASLSFAGFAGLSSADADSTAQGTDPIRIENATVDLGSATLEIGSAALMYDSGAIVFQGESWTATAGSRTVELGGATVAVENVDAETYAQVRDAMVQSANQRSLSPLVAGLVEAEVSPSAPVGIRAGPISSDGKTLVDEIDARGTVGSVVPEGWSETAAGQPMTELGAAQFDTVTLERGGVSMTAEEVVAEPFSDGLSVTASSGSVDTAARSLEFANLNTTFRPPAEGAEPHANALAGMRRLAADGSLTASAVRTTLAESGVTLDNTVAAMQDTRFAASVESVTQNGESVLQNFETSGTLSELMQLIRQRV